VSGLSALFLDNLLPIFLAAGAGSLLSRLLGVAPRTLSQVTFYIFSPALIFTLLVHSQLNNTAITSMVGFALMVNLLVGATAFLIARAACLERRMIAAVLITTMFMNAGNFGLSVNSFAFGEDALSFASLFFVTNSMMVYTFGVIIASMGKTGLKQALLNLTKLPLIYAMILAFVFLFTGWQLPLPIDRTVTLLGQAAIPAMLVLLGMQLQHAQWNGQVLPLAITSLVRLLISPAIAILLALVFGLQGASRQAGILEAAMPTAVITTILAIEYDVEPTFVTAAVFVTTLLSALTLTPLLAYLGT
jgi:predicted permease